MRWWKASLATGLGRDDYVKLSREFSELGPVIEAIKAYRAVTAEIADLDALIADAVDRCRDAQAGGSRKAGACRRAGRSSNSKSASRLIPKDAMDDHNAILEIRAGTGGDEAALFAGDLFRMYERYAAKQGWKTEILSLSEGTKGGFKEIVAEVARPRRLRQAQIRIRRAPRAARARHRSLRPHPHLGRDRRGAAGGRRRRYRDQRRRSQDRHHARAGRRRPARQQDRIRHPHHPPAERHRRVRAGGTLAAQEQGQGDEACCAPSSTTPQRSKLDAERAAERRGQIGSGDRSERIRTYNFPQGRVTDHRINLTLHKLPQVMEGEALDEIIDALVTEHQAELLAAEGAT